MIKIIKRTTDNHYLKSIENDEWVEDLNFASEYNFKESEQLKEILLNTYTKEQIKEIINPFKFKKLTLEEKKELRNMLKK